MNLLKTNQIAEKAKFQLNNVKAKALGISSAIALAMPQIAQAAPSNDPGQIVQKACDVVVGIFPFIGAFFALSGVFKLILAYRNDQPEAQTAAAKDIVIGAVFIAFRVFVWDAIKGVVF